MGLDSDDDDDDEMSLDLNPAFNAAPEPNKKSEPNKKWRSANQIKILLWKNGLLKRRKCCATCLEMLAPIALFMILVSIRTLSPVAERPAQALKALPLQSDGLKEFGVGFCCNGTMLNSATLPGKSPSPPKLSPIDTLQARLGEVGVTGDNYETVLKELVMVWSYGSPESVECRNAAMNFDLGHKQQRNTHRLYPTRVLQSCYKWQPTNREMALPMPIFETKSADAPSCQLECKQFAACTNFTFEVSTRSCHLLSLRSPEMSWSNVENMGDTLRQDGIIVGPVACESVSNPHQSTMTMENDRWYTTMREAASCLFKAPPTFVMDGDDSAAFVAKIAPIAPTITGILFAAATMPGGVDGYMQKLQDDFNRIQKALTPDNITDAEKQSSGAFGYGQGNTALVQAGCGLVCADWDPNHVYVGNRAASAALMLDPFNWMGYTPKFGEPQQMISMARNIWKQLSLFVDIGASAIPALQRLAYVQSTPVSETALRVDTFRIRNVAWLNEHQVALTTTELGGTVDNGHDWNVTYFDGDTMVTCSYPSPDDDLGVMYGSTHTLQLLRTITVESDNAITCRSLCELDLVCLQYKVSQTSTGRTCQLFAGFGSPTDNSIMQVSRTPLICKPVGADCAIGIAFTTSSTNGMDGIDGRIGIDWGVFKLPFLTRSKTGCNIQWSECFAKHLTGRFLQGRTFTSNATTNKISQLAGIVFDPIFSINPRRWYRATTLPPPRISTEFKAKQNFGGSKISQSCRDGNTMQRYSSAWTPQVTGKHSVFISINGSQVVTFKVTRSNGDVETHSLVNRPSCDEVSVSMNTSRFELDVTKGEVVDLELWRAPTTTTCESLMCNPDRNVNSSLEDCDGARMFWKYYWQPYRVTLEQPQPPYRGIPAPLDILAPAGGKCAANHGTSKACCNQPDTNVELKFQCPANRPHCVGYVLNNTWGNCNL